MLRYRVVVDSWRDFGSLLGPVPVPVPYDLRSTLQHQCRAPRGHLTEVNGVTECTHAGYSGQKTQGIRNSR